MQKGVIPLELFRLLGTIAIENSEANKEIKNTTDNAEEAKGKMSAAFKKIGKAVAAGFAVSKIIEFGQKLVSIADETREYRTEMGKLEAAYATAGHSADAAKSTFSALSAVLGDDGQAVEAANHLAKLVDNEKDLQTWTDICTGVYATFGASLPIEGLTEAANETAKTGSLTGGLADALNWAGVSEDDFQASLDACSTEQERQALITDTLNGLYATAAENYKEVNKDVLDANAAQGKLNEGLAAVGAIVEPVISKFKYLAGEVLLAVVDAVKNVIDVAKRMVDRFIAIKEAVSNAIDTVKDFLGLDGKSANITANTSVTTANGNEVNVKKHAAGGVLTKPTIFGYTPSTGTYHLGGEAGAEAIAPIDVLQGYVRQAVAEGSNTEETNSLLKQLIDLQKKTLQAMANTKIELDGREFGRAVKSYA